MSQNSTIVTASTYAIYIPLQNIVGPFVNKMPLARHPYSGSCLTIFGEMLPLIIAGKAFETLRKEAISPDCESEKIQAVLLSGCMSSPLTAIAVNIQARKNILGDLRAVQSRLPATAKAAFLNIAQTNGLSGFFTGYRALTLGNVTLSMNLFYLRPKLEEHSVFVSSVAAGTLTALVYHPALRLSHLQHYLKIHAIQYNKEPIRLNINSLFYQRKFFSKHMNGAIIAQSLLMGTYSGFERFYSGSGSKFS